MVDPVVPATLDVNNPRTEQVSGRIALGSAADVDLAVLAAQQAFEMVGDHPEEDRLAVLGTILAEYRRMGEPWPTRSARRWAPAGLAGGPQINLGIGHLAAAIDAPEELRVRVRPWLHHGDQRTSPGCFEQGFHVLSKLVHGARSDTPARSTIRSPSERRSPSPIRARWASTIAARVRSARAVRPSTRSDGLGRTGRTWTPPNPVTGRTRTGRTRTDRTPTSRSRTARRRDRPNPNGPDRNSDRGQSPHQRSGRPPAIRHPARSA